MIETIQLRRDTAANWASLNPILAQSEVGTETDTGKAKLGDGVTAWNSLPYWAGVAGAVASVFGRTGPVAAEPGDYTVGQVTGAAPLASPALTGTPTAPTQTTGDTSTKIATDQFVATAVAAETTRAEAAEALLVPQSSTQAAAGQTLWSFTPDQASTPSPYSSRADTQTFGSSPAVTETCWSVGYNVNQAAAGDISGQLKWLPNCGDTKTLEWEFSGNFPDGTAYLGFQFKADRTGTDYTTWDFVFLNGSGNGGFFSISDTVTTYLSAANGSITLTHGATSGNQVKIASSSGTLALFSAAGGIQFYAGISVAPASGNAVFTLSPASGQATVSLQSTGSSSSQLNLNPQGTGSAYVWWMSANSSLYRLNTTGSSPPQWQAYDQINSSVIFTYNTSATAGLRNLTLGCILAMGSNKITGLANGSGAQDAAAFGQIPTSAASIGGLLAANSLSDVASASTARANLGLGTAAVDSAGTFAQVANNLDDLASAATALANLGGLPGYSASQVLATAEASITFSSIPSGYSVLRLLVIGASSTAAEATRWQVRVNGDSGSHYDIEGVVGAGNNVNAAAYSDATTQQWIIASGGSGLDLPGANATAGIAGILEVTIPAYAGTALQKTGLWRSGYADGATGTAAADNGIWTQVVAWRSTAAISSISIIPVAGNLVAGTAAYLYLS
jgi:hypothetical protein